MVFVILAAALFAVCQFVGLVFGLASQDLRGGFQAGCLIWGLIMAIVAVLWLTRGLLEAVA